MLFSSNRVRWGKYQRRVPLRRPGCRWQDNIKIDFKWVGGSGINLALDKDIMCAVVDMVMNHHVQ